MISLIYFDPEMPAKNLGRERDHSDSFKWQFVDLLIQNICLKDQCRSDFSKLIIVFLFETNEIDISSSHFKPLLIVSMPRSAAGFSLNVLTASSTILCL